MLLGSVLASPMERLVEIHVAQVRFLRSDHVGMYEHAGRCLAKQPTERVVGVRADIGETSGRGQFRVVSPRERHRCWTRIVPAIDHREHDQFLSTLF